MIEKTAINSDSYWDNRFAQDWETYEGPRQSRFFSRIAIDLLPPWLTHEIRARSLTLADWGCAQGDGTDAWTSHVPPQQITGIDFSSVAIEKANKNYPAIRFVQQNWLAQDEKDAEKFDIVFSSNTLEHFHSPYDVLQTICNHAEKAVVLALPYKEQDRIDEHFFSFFPQNIPSSLKNGFRLIWSRVADCRHLPGSLWNGDQIVLIYADPAWLDMFKLSLQDCRVEHADNDAVIGQLRRSLNECEVEAEALKRALPAHHCQIEALTKMAVEREQLVTTLTKKISECEDQIATMQNAASDHDRKIEALQTAIGERDKTAHKSEAARAMERRELMRLSDLVASINERPFTYGVKRLLLTTAKATYRRLPLTTSTKLKMRTIALKGLQKLRTNNSNGARLDAAQAHLDAEGLPGTVMASAASSEAYQNLCSVAAAKTLNTREDVFIFSVIDWHFRIQRPQHIARGLAKSGKRVFFFSNHFVDSQVPGYEIEQLDPSLDLYQIKLHVPGAPAIYFAPPDMKSKQMITLGVGKLIRDFAALSTVSIVEHAYWHPITTSIPNTIRVYDCMDNHEAFGNVPEALIALENELLTTSDLVIVTSTVLEDIAKRRNENVSVIRNAGEYDHFCTAPVERFKDAQSRKIIGYYGAIADWFDLDLVRAVAVAYPDAVILLVGNDTVGASKALGDLPNVIFTGEVPYSRLPYYLHSFDVCLLPFKVVPLTLATNPVKVYEYLAAGKDTVCVDLPEIGQFGDLVYKGKSHDEFTRLVGACLEQPADEPTAKKRRQFASDQTWQHRCEDLIAAVERTHLPKISVVVLTYNNLHLTKACIESLLCWSDYPNMEVIIVDNASTDGTPAYLTDFVTRHPEVRLILNEKNLGFAAGNNVGLQAATGDYLVMLNNDTVVTPGWLLTMLRHLQADPHCGIVGPVTNNIGNEAKIDIEYKTSEEMLPLAVTYTTSHMGQSMPMRTVAFFCVMLSREMFERVGPLDEHFGRGFFEDDDYCRRIEQLGFRIACVEDVFVHHHLSASFNKLGNTERTRLFEENKAYYETKWGTWNPHQPRLQNKY